MNYTLELTKEVCTCGGTPPLGAPTSLLGSYIPFVPSVGEIEVEISESGSGSELYTYPNNLKVSCDASPTAYVRWQIQVSVSPTTILSLAITWAGTTWNYNSNMNAGTLYTDYKLCPLPTTNCTPPPPPPPPEIQPPFDDQFGTPYAFTYGDVSVNWSTTGGSSGSIQTIEAVPGLYLPL
jgi:hypothetical protein